MKAETKTKTAVEESPDEVLKKGKVEKKAGKRVGYNYIIVKSLKENKKNDVVKCLYIKSFSDFGFCVIKEGAEGDTKDKAGRDIRDRLKWQKELHQQLRGKVNLPKYLGSFEENGNYYLVMELIRGDSLTRRIKTAGRSLRNELLHGGKNGFRFVGYLLQVIDILSALHKEQIVHRDASGGNFVIDRWGKVRVIDMELSYSVAKQFPSPVFELGTHGYMSPQQEESQTPSIHEDIFAIGAIVLQVFTGISPSKLTRPLANELVDRVRFFIPDLRLSEVVAKCLEPEVARRGSLKELKEALVGYRMDLRKSTKRPVNKVNELSTELLYNAIQHGINVISSPLMADPEKGWFAQNQNTVKEDRSKIDKEYYGSFQFGVSGAMYFIGKAARAGMNVEKAMPHVRSALKLIETKYINSGISGSPGLYYGAAGVAASLYSACNDGLIKGEETAGWINSLLQRTNKEHNFLNGKPGQSVSLLQCLPVLGSWCTERLEEDFLFMSQLQKPNGSWVTFRERKSNKEILHSGMHYGISGVAWYLLEHYRVLKNDTALRRAEAAIEFLIKKMAISRKKMIEWHSGPKKKAIDFGWCAGYGGIVLTLLKAYEITGHPLYKTYAENTLNGVDENILDSDLSQCHGLSGLGELYLEAFRVLKDESWQKRAGWIAQVLMNMRNWNPKYGNYWVVGHEKHSIAGFMTGNSGILHFLLRYLHSEKIFFPLLDYRNYAGKADFIAKPSQNLSFQIG